MLARFPDLLAGDQFGDESPRRWLRELLRRLNEIPGVDLPNDAITRRPSIPLALLAQNDERLASFLHTLDWFHDTVRADGSAGE